MSCSIAVILFCICVKPFYRICIPWDTDTLTMTYSCHHMLRLATLLLNIEHGRKKIQDLKDDKQETSI